MDRLQQKNDLYFKLGALFNPLLQLINRPEDYNEQEQARILARYCAEYNVLINDFHHFSIGEPGHNYFIQESRFSNALNRVLIDIEQHDLELSEVVPENLAIAKAAIDAVPIPVTSIIEEAGTPFSTYCKVKSLCEVDATHSLIWIDQYMDANIFHRYLSSVRPNVFITLVSSEPDSRAGKTNKNRWIEFLDISRIFAQERGANKYRLVVHENLHDRWIVFDNKRIYHLGGSIKDAADKTYHTITTVEPSPINLSRVQEHTNTGIEFFGLSTQQHQPS
jgi:hypothetical protein